MLPNGIRPMGAAIGRPEASLGRHQMLVEEGIPSSEADSFGAASGIWHERRGRRCRGRAIQPIGCTICIGPRHVARKHRQPHLNERFATTADCGTASAASERKQRSAGNVCAPHPTAHDEHVANATTSGTWTTSAIWRTRQRARRK